MRELVVIEIEGAAGAANWFAAPAVSNQGVNAQNREFSQDGFTVKSVDLKYLKWL